MELDKLSPTLNKPKQGKIGFNPERDVEDKSLPYSKLQLSGKITNSDIAADANLDVSKLHSDVQYKQTVWEQNLTTNTLRSSQVIYRGWTYLVGAGIASVQGLLTLPNGGYDDTEYDVFVHVLGTKNDSNPTSRTDVDLATIPYYLTTLLAVTALTKTNFTFVIADVDETAIAVTRRILVSWMTIGTKT
jgi:hypothetical protein